MPGKVSKGRLGFGLLPKVKSDSVYFTYTRKVIPASVFGKSKKSCKNLVLRRKKFVRILASLARKAPLKNDFFHSSLCLRQV